MAFFRFHRGSFEESVQTTIEVNSIEELSNLLLIELKLDVDDTLTIRKLNKIDSRNNWDTHIVTVNSCAVGYTNLQLGEEFMSYNLLGSSQGLLEYVEITPKSLDDWIKLDNETYHLKGDTQQLMYVSNNKYYVQRASVYSMIRLKKINVIPS
jgi:hypothetical protein